MSASLLCGIISSTPSEDLVDKIRPSVSSRNEFLISNQIHTAEKACQKLPLTSFHFHGNGELSGFEQNSKLCKDDHRGFYCAEKSLPHLPFSLWRPSAVAIDEPSSELHRNLDEYINTHAGASQKLERVQELYVKLDKSNHLQDLDAKQETRDIHIKIDESTSQTDISLQDSYADISSWKLSQDSRTCPASVELTIVRQLQVSMILEGVDWSAGSTTCLISLYTKCGGLQDITQILHKIPNRSLSTWHVTILAYSFFGENATVLELFFESQEEGFVPTPSIFVCVLRACGDLRDIQLGMMIHEQLIVSGFDPDSRIGSGLTVMYVKCGRMEEARIIFENLLEQSAGLWDALIAGYARSGEVVPAFELFEEMTRKGINPTNFMFSCILKMCGEIKALEKGRVIHDQVIKLGFQKNVNIGNGFLIMYSKCGKLEDSRQVFEELQNRNVVSWGIMLRGYIQHDQADFALKLFERMQDEGTRPNKAIFLCLLNACASLGAKEQGKFIHDHITNIQLDLDVDIGSTLVDMYAKCGDLKEARRVFDGLSVRNVVSWNAMITGYVNEDHSLEALHLFERMRYEGYEPNHVTFLCMLRACGKIGALGQVMLLHNHIVRHLLDSTTPVVNALVDSYCKCGRLEEARHIFDELTTRDIVSWGGMLAGYAQNGDCESVRGCLESMRRQGLKPDALIYTSALTACSREGNVEAGIGYFRSMKEVYGLNPGIEHFNCLVNILGDAGHLNEADELVETMPVPPDTTTWLTVLRACRKYGKVSLGRACFDRVYTLDVGCAAAYMLMSSVYADACMWEDAKKIRALRKSVGVWKKPGKAWIEVNHKVHEFVVGDRTHPQSERVYAKLESLRQSMKEEGYVTQLSSAFHPFSGKEDALCGHSERLAVAFGILSTPEYTTIRVRKNLRICSECHTTFKYAAKREKRRIFLKDSHRSHHFEYGNCSCGDKF